MRSWRHLLNLACFTKASIRNITITRSTRDDVLPFHILGQSDTATSHGIFISKVERNTKAYEAGLRRGDQVSDRLFDSPPPISSSLARFSMPMDNRSITSPMRELWTFFVVPPISRWLWRTIWWVRNSFGSWIVWTKVLLTDQRWMRTTWILCRIEWNRESWQIACSQKASRSLVIRTRNSTQTKSVFANTIQL